MPGKRAGSFQEIASRLALLTDELAAAHEGEMERLRAENTRLLAQIGETDPQPAPACPPASLPGSMPGQSDGSSYAAGRPETLGSLAEGMSMSPVVPSFSAGSKQSSTRVTPKKNVATPRGFSSQCPPVSEAGTSMRSVLSLRPSFPRVAELFRGSRPSRASEMSGAVSILSRDEEKHLRKSFQKGGFNRGQTIEAYELAKRHGPLGVMMMHCTGAGSSSHSLHESGARRAVVRIISMPLFDAFLGFIIMANAITIGIETSYSVHNERVPMELAVVETVFLTVYMIELALRYYALGMQRACKSYYMRFDTFLVLSGVMDFIIKVVLVNASAEVLDKLMLIRMLRLARLARTLRLMVQFRTLWLLVQGLLHSLLTLMWTLVIILMLCYCFSIIGMEFIRASPEYGPEYFNTAQANFNNLGDAMLTHLQFLTLDGIAAIYRPLVKARPELCVYFVSFIMLVSIALMNLVTAIMVESSLRQAKEDQVAQQAWESAKKKALLPKLQKMFEEMDTDASGLLDVEELNGASEEIKSQLQRICNMEDVEEIFKSLDYDENGTVDIEEFCQSLLKATTEKPGELIRIMKQCSEILTHTRKASLILGTEYPHHGPAPAAEPQAEGEGRRGDGGASASDAPCPQREPPPAARPQLSSIQELQ